MQTEKLQRALLVFGFMVSAILLGRFTIDFIQEMPLVLSLPFLGLCLAALGVAAWNIRQTFQAPNQTPIKPLMRIALLAALPLGFWAAALDCSGLAWQGCTPFCTFIKIAWIPLIAVLAMVAGLVAGDGLMMGISLMAYVTLVPHCLCFNVGNGWWIERVGASPMCYVWGFVMTGIVVSALKSKTRVGLSLLVCGAILAGAFGFFIAHHYFHFPW